MIYLAKIIHFTGTARFGSAQVRASGRVCANIANASPIGDLSPCFLALGAEILLNRGGDKRQIRLEDFFRLCTARPFTGDEAILFTPIG